MNKLQKMRYFSMGLIAALLVGTMANPALAALISKTISVSTGINLYVDDNKFTPKDANGNPVEVFIYNGTTYLPARAISEAVGKPIQWDGKTSSVYVGKHTSSTPAILLGDMTAFYEAGVAFVKYTSLVDNLGITRHNCLSSSRKYTLSVVNNTYKINGKYSKISGTLFMSDEYKNDNYITTIEIYGDGNLLYTANIKGGIEPIDFNVDLNGILELRFYMKGWTGTLSNVGLYT